ncbi:hypothetical protein Leryth_004041 [Lithospermum erythrorhizon]|nr:hypothetical protein Leryth_004041 [Lithospermum erythrorhizon]
MGGGGDKHLNMNFHIHIPQIHFHHHQGGSGNKRDVNHIPKGCVAIMVGQGEELQRFIIPVMYMNHPLFMQLLKEAEEEYGFEHSGPINIPCHVEEFRYVQGLIDKQTSHHHQHLHNIYWCFKA